MDLKTVIKDAPVSLLWEIIWLLTVVDTVILWNLSWLLLQATWKICDVAISGISEFGVSCVSVRQIISFFVNLSSNARSVKCLFKDLTLVLLSMTPDGYV